MMRAHKQQVTIVRKSESSVNIFDFRSEFRSKVNRVTVIGINNITSGMRRRENWHGYSIYL